MSCGYEGQHFGAQYNNAACIDSYLWDLDSYDEPRGALYQGGDIGCPCYNTKEYLDYHDFRPSGNAKQRRKRIRKAISKIKSWATPLKGGAA